MKNVLCAVLLGTGLMTSGAFGDESLGGLSARIADLENKMNGQTSNGDESASKEELEILRGLVRELRGEIEELKYAIASRGSSTSTSQGESLLDRPTDVSKASFQRERGSLNHGSAKQSSDVGDDDIDDLLKNLGGGDDFESKKPDPKKKNGDEDRNKATHLAEKNAPTGTLEVGDSTAQYNQALALYKSKEYAEAEESFRYYLTQYKSGKQTSQAKLKVAQCQLALAREHKDKNRAKEASKEFASIYKTNSKGALGAEALLGMGDAMGYQGEGKKACVVLKKLKADFPNDKEICKKASDLIKQYESKRA